MSGWPRRAMSFLAAAAAVLAIASTVMIVAAAVAGYRPVVITTGSMGDHAPAGSLVIAAPTADVGVGDVLVMRRDGVAPVTHRVIEIQRHDETTFAITKGDANETADPMPYALGQEELVGRTVVPRVGDLILAADDPAVTLLVVTSVVLIGVFAGLRRIWHSPANLDRRPRPRRVRSAQRRLAAAVIAIVGLLGGSVAWAVYSASGSVAGNVFSTRDCFDAQLGSVQHGQTINSVDGTQSVPITSVDPTRSFLMVSMRSAANEPADSMLQAQLVSPTAIELTRRTDAPGPAPIVIDWSIVEYSCGMTVQRGTTAGNDLSALDIPVSTVDIASSFVVLSSVGAIGDTDFGAESMAIAELTDPTTLRLRTAAPTTLRSSASYAWQVVSFEDPTDVSVQTVSTTLGAAVSTSLPIGLVDPATTFVLATTATSSAGPDLGERMVRAHLSSTTSVDIDRQIAGDPIEVHVQVVELRDGSTVEHGTVDFAVGQPARTVIVGPVDPARTTTFGTVQVPGSLSGGSTDMTGDDIAGEATATFELTDPTHVTLTRDAVTAAASFGWQAVEWGGPGWWDPTSPFRQRIDVTTGTAAAPGGYSAPVVVDHQALVASGLSIPTGDDLRVLRWDGSVWSELDRVLDDASAWNAVDTTIWFRTIDAIAATTTDSYWLYFGDNTPPAPLADPENVWLLTEGFESGTLGDFEDRTAGTSWYQADPWTRRIPLTIAAGAVTVDLTDFTVLVDITDLDLAANAQTDGDDLRFTAADGVTSLAHEIERWNPGTGELIAWVRLPSLPSAATSTIYLYYGAADAPAQSAPRATWPAATFGAWHLDRDPAGPAPQADDRTAFNHDGVARGAMTGSDLVPGLIGNALDFDGIDDHLDLGQWEVATLHETTVSAWVNLDSFAAHGRVFTKADDPVTRVIELAHEGSAARARIQVDGTTTEVTGGVLSTGAWHHLAAVWDGTNLHLYVDGAHVGAGAAHGVIDSAPTMPVTIGDLAGGTRPLDGRIDEVRVDAVARSSAWLDATERNQRTPGTFVTPGSAEIGSWFGVGSWSARKPVAINAGQIDATLIDHALLVQITDLQIAAAAQADGDDIVFTAADGLARLDHDVESWNGGTGDLTAWVRIPSLDSSADTSIFVYYGNPAAVDQQDPAATFGPEADLVAHLAG